MTENKARKVREYEKGEDGGGNWLHTFRASFGTQNRTDFNAFIDGAGLRKQFLPYKCTGIAPSPRLQGGGVAGGEPTALLCFALFTKIHSDAPF